MEPSRVKAIEDWVEPKNVHEMRVFLGMTNYQRKFCRGVLQGNIITDRPIEERQEVELDEQMSKGI